MVIFKLYFYGYYLNYFDFIFYSFLILFLVEISILTMNFIFFLKLKSGTLIEKDKFYDFKKLLKKDFYLKIEIKLDE